MTEYVIKAEAFLRLSKAALQPDETHNKFNDTMRGVRIINQNSVSIAVATCGRLLVGEYLGAIAEDEEAAITVTIDPRLLAIAETEAAQDGSLHVVQTPGWTVVRGTHGQMLPINGEIPGEYPDWQGLIPSALPSKSNGAFIFNGAIISRMGETCPTGVFVLPRHVDMKMPVFVRDQTDDSWFGAFLVTDDGKQPCGPADLPVWLVR